MDQDWINELTNNFKSKICEILNVCLEMGVTNEKFVKRSNSLRKHVENLLNDMLDEENRHKSEVENSVESLNNDIRKLCSDLNMECKYEFNGTLINMENSLLVKKAELSSIKDVRIKKFHALLELEDELCVKLYEYKLNLDPDLIPTECQLESLEKKINELEIIKFNRAKEFSLKRRDIKYYYLLLDKGQPNDALVQNIFKDKNAVNLPLSKDFLYQCDCLINQLKLEYQKLVDKSKDLRERYEKLHIILYPSIDVTAPSKYISKNCNEYSYSILNLLEKEVLRLENERLEKIDDFAKTYQYQIREKLRSNFCSYLEGNANYQWLLNSEKFDESILENLEAEFEKWCTIEKELEPLKVLMESWESLFNKLIEINTNLRNPVILKNRGGILLKVEKDKNLVKKELPKCEAKIREFLLSRNETTISSNDLKINDKVISEYISYMWSQVEGDKENERKERKLKPGNSKLDVSKVSNKPLQIAKQKSFISNLGKNEFKKPVTLKLQSKIPLKKSILSPITNRNPIMKTNLDRRFSKSYNCICTKPTKERITGSTSNLYELFCKNVKGGAITSSFVENYSISRK